MTLNNSSTKFVSGQFARLQLNHFLNQENIVSNIFWLTTPPIPPEKIFIATVLHIGLMNFNSFTFLTT